MQEAATSPARPAVWVAPGSPAFQPPVEGNGGEKFPHFGDGEAAVGVGQNEADWDLTDSLGLTTGVRSPRDQQDYKGCSADFYGNMVPNVNVTNRFLFFQFHHLLAEPISGGQCNTFDNETGTFGLVRSHTDEDNVSWRVVLDRQFNPDTLFYASAAQGYKSGVTPVGAANLAAITDPVEFGKLLRAIDRPPGRRSWPRWRRSHCCRRRTPGTWAPTFPASRGNFELFGTFHLSGEVHPKRRGGLCRFHSELMPCLVYFSLAQYPAIGAEG